MRSLNDVLPIYLPANKEPLPKPAFARAGGYRVFCIMLALLINSVVSVYAQDKDYAVDANIIYRFTKYVDWPDNKKSGDFVIGIVGESPLYEYLKTFVVNKTVGNQKIIVKTYSSLSAEFDCHILFVSEDESSRFKKIVARTAGAPILLVSEEEGLAYRGSCINFVVADDRLKLEINRTNIQQRHLNVATELLDLGKNLK
jgi:hypothetical protein